MVRLASSLRTKPLDIQGQPAGALHLPGLRRNM
jgi:hypothetical protein